MDRREFLQGCCAMFFLTSLTGSAETSESPNDANLKFIQNWVSDLMETLDSDFPEEQKIKLMDGCGRGCYRRFTWKQDIAAKGKGSPEKLIEALKANFEVWREGNQVHIRYGAVDSYGCYCPAAKYRPGKSKDITAIARERCIRRSGKPRSARSRGSISCSRYAAAIQHATSWCTWREPRECWTAPPVEFPHLLWWGQFKG